MIHIKQQFKVSVSVCVTDRIAAAGGWGRARRRQWRRGGRGAQWRRRRRGVGGGFAVLDRRYNYDNIFIVVVVRNVVVALIELLGLKQRDVISYRNKEIWVSIKLKIVCTEKKKVNTNKMLWTYCWVAHHSETGSPSSFGSIPCIHPLLALLGLFGQVCCDGIQKKVYLLHRYLYSSLRVNVRCNKTVTRATEILKF